MEVIYDLDIEAQAVARERGVNMLRAGTVGVHPKFLRMIRELIADPGSHDACPADCCPAPARRVGSALGNSSSVASRRGDFPGTTGAPS
jgi:ferrochelatase